MTTHTRGDLRDTVHTIAEILDGRQVGAGIPHEARHRAAASGLEIVYATDNDVIVFDGAVKSEHAWDHDAPTYAVRSDSVEHLHPDWRRAGGHPYVIASFCAIGRPQWRFTTNAPHSTFDILDGDLPVCRGLVLRTLSSRAPSHWLDADGRTLLGVQPEQIALVRQILGTDRIRICLTSGSTEEVKIADADQREDILRALSEHASRSRAQAPR